MTSVLSRNQTESQVTEITQLIFGRTLRNRRLADIIGLLLDQAHRVRMFTLRFRALPVRSTEEHAEMVSLLEERDAEGLASLFRRHRETAARELFEILERYDLKYL